MTVYLDRETLQETTESHSWRFDKVHLVALVDLLFAETSSHGVEVLTAYYQRILDGKWPEEGRDEPYHPAPKWPAAWVPGLPEWDYRSKLSTQQKARMKQVGVWRVQIEKDFIRQIMEAYFQAKRLEGGEIPHRQPGDWEKKVAEHYRTR